MSSYYVIISTFHLPRSSHLRTNPWDLHPSPKRCLRSQGPIDKLRHPSGGVGCDQVIGVGLRDAQAHRLTASRRKPIPTVGVTRITCQTLVLVGQPGSGGNPQASLKGGQPSEPTASCRTCSGNCRCSSRILSMTSRLKIDAQNAYTRRSPKCWNTVL